MGKRETEHIPIKLHQFKRFNTFAALKSSMSLVSMEFALIRWAMRVERLCAGMNEDFQRRNTNEIKHQECAARTMALKPSGEIARSQRRRITDK